MSKARAADPSVATTLLGYGTFHLEWFQPGEQFCRYDGSIGEVCRHQPERTPNSGPPLRLLPDHLHVWTAVGTSNAMKVYLHRHAIVHAVTREQALDINRRIEQRRKGGVSCMTGTS